MRRPVNMPFSITTQFGVPDSNAKFGRHSGIDYAVPKNRPIYAPTSGQLTNVVSPTGGNMVVIQSGGLWHRLMHNNSFSRGNGPVREGEEVGKAGTTGLSTGVHCHWDINNQGTYPTSFDRFINPNEWLKGADMSTNPTRPQIATLWLLTKFKDLNQADPATRENVYSYYESRPLQELLNDLSKPENRKEVVDQYLAGANAGKITKEQVINYISNNLK